MPRLQILINDLVQDIQQLLYQPATRRTATTVPALGFTIVEILVVVSIIAVLASIVIVAYFGITNRSHDTAVQKDLAATAKAIELYKVDSSNNRYPTSSTHLSTMRSDGKYQIKASRGSYMDSVNNFVYCINNGSGSTNAGTSYALAARSKSGKAFYTSGSSGAVTEMSGSWSSTSATLCGSIDSDLATGAWGYAYSSSTWSSWVME
jgi:prepilin-type N-terminal cleavage/methylation domain-containing protein